MENTLLLDFMGNLITFIVIIKKSTCYEIFTITRPYLLYEELRLNVHTSISSFTVVV